MTYRTGHRGSRRPGRWLPWIVLLVVVLFVTGGMNFNGPMHWSMGGFSGLIPLIVIGAVAFFLWTWWNGDDMADVDDAGDSRASRRQRRHLRHDRAYRVLRERFANGEIDEQEYLARKSVLFE